VSLFCENIRQRRLELGRTQREVAAAIGISSADFISLVEQGHRRLELERVPALAQVLELDPALLCRQALEARAPQFAAHLFAREAQP
jgi:transcriptional regulator with XRE-family HTH domain